MTMASKLVAVSAIGVAWIAGCSSKDTEPAPLLEDCVGANCKPAGGGSGGGSKPGGEGGAGGSGDEEPSTITVSGTVLSTVDSGFITATTYVGGALVRAQGESGTQVQSETAAGQFTIDDVATGLNWFALEEVSTQRTLLPTLQPVVVSEAEPQTSIVGVDEQVFLAVLDTMSPVQVLQSGAAQAILFFARENGEPVKGVSIKGWANAEAVAYDAAPTYEVASPPDEGATGELGTALLVNIYAVPYPGSSVEIQFEVDGELLVVPIRVASNYVTRAAIAVD